MKTVGVAQKRIAPHRTTGIEVTRVDRMHGTPLVQDELDLSIRKMWLVGVKRIAGLLA